MHVPCFQSVLVSSTVETGLPQNRMISSEHGWNRPVVPLLVSNLIQRIVLALWIWQVSLTFYARYQHPYLVLWRCHQKHMWPVWGPRRAQHIPKTVSSFIIISCIFKYSAIQNIATWILNHYLANVDLTFPGGRNLFLSGYLHRGASEIFTMAAVGVEAWLGHRYHQVTWVVSAE